MRLALAIALVLPLASCGRPQPQVRSSAAFQKFREIPPITLTRESRELQEVSVPSGMDQEPTADSGFVYVVHDPSIAGGLVRKRSKDGLVTDLVRVPAGAPFDPTLLADGRLFLGISTRKEPPHLVMIPPNGTAADVRTIATGVVRGVVSNDGTTVAFDRDGQLWVTPVDKPSPRAIGKGDAPRLSPDGTFLAYVSADKRTVVLNLQSNARLEIGLGQSPVWSPKGDALAILRGDDIIRIRVDGTEPVVLAHAPEAMGLRWTADDVMCIVRGRFYRFVPHPLESPG